MVSPTHPRTEFFICSPAGNRTQPHRLKAYCLHQFATSEFTRVPVANFHEHLTFIFTFNLHLFNHFARDVGIEPTHRGFGDLTDTLSVSRIYERNIKRVLFFIKSEVTLLVTTRICTLEEI